VATQKFVNFFVFRIVLRKPCF